LHLGRRRIELKPEAPARENLVQTLARASSAFDEAHRGGLPDFHHRITRAASHVSLALTRSIGHDRGEEDVFQHGDGPRRHRQESIANIGPVPSIRYPVNCQQYKTAYDRDGFVVVPEFLPRDELAALTANLDRYIREVVPTLADAHAFYEDRARPETLKQLQHMGIDPFFANFAEHPRWRDLAQALVGEAATADSPEWFNKPPGTNHVTPPHQDNYYFCLRPPNVVTIWLALDPVEEENGCLRYVAGSHLSGVRPHAATRALGFSQGISDYGPLDRSREVLVRLRPGDAVAHHGETIHRAEANASATRNRRAFAIVFKGASCRRDAAAFANYQQSLRAQHEQLGLTV
jgi:2-oxoglutarate-dependent dioxygenase